MDRFKIETYLYDLRSVQKESDDPANAILFKYPSDISINKALARVGNFVALYQSTTSLIGHSGLKIETKHAKVPIFFIINFFLKNLLILSKQLQ